MASNADPEKAEVGTIGTNSTPDQSDSERFETNKIEEGAIGEPDIGHEEVERMNPLHLEDLERQHVRNVPNTTCEHSLISLDKSINQSWTTNINRHRPHTTSQHQSQHKE